MAEIGYFDAAGNPMPSDEDDDARSEIESLRADVERLQNLTRIESDEITELKDRLQMAYHERDVSDAAKVAAESYAESLEEYGDQLATAVGMVLRGNGTDEIDADFLRATVSIWREARSK